MRLFALRPGIRHPLFPRLAVSAASKCSHRVSAITGTLVDLERAAARGVRVERAVFVQMDGGDLLGDEDRDWLWVRFQAPVYAIALDAAERVVAWECEAQHGMHVASGGDETGACACGRPGARVVSKTARPKLAPVA